MGGGRFIHPPELLGLLEDVRGGSGPRDVAENFVSSDVVGQRLLLRMFFSVWFCSFSCVYF